jgi:hypothetical protein
MTRPSHAAGLWAALLGGAVIAVCLTADPSAAQQADAPVIPPEYEAPLANLRTALDETEYEAVRDEANALIPALLQVPERSAGVRAALVMAYEYRARALFGLNDEAAVRADLQAILALDPDYQLGSRSQRLLDLFANLRTQTLGEFTLAITPSDAQLTIDGKPVSATEGRRALPAGSYPLEVSKRGYRPVRETLVIAAGTHVERQITLERVFAVLSIVTAPHGVEVVLDGAAIGTTLPVGPEPKEQDVTWARSAGVAPGDFSSPFLVDVGVGDHIVEFRKNCHTRLRATYPVKDLKDYQLREKLTPAIATLKVATTERAANLFLNNEARGTAPRTITDACEGTGTVLEVRSPRGRYVRRLNIRAGDDIAVEAIVRPAVALLSIDGQPLTGRPTGGFDPRERIERELADAPETFFAPALDQVRSAYQSSSLEPGWLSFDALRKPLSSTAKEMDDAARLRLSIELARALGVQGVAEITPKGGAGSGEFYVSVLAEGSGRPDVLSLPSVPDPESLTLAPPVYWLSPGVSVVDVLDGRGPVVVSVETGSDAAASGVVPGDTVLRFGDEDVPDAASLTAALERRQPGDKVQMALMNRRGQPHNVTTTLRASPRLISFEDETLAANRLILQYQFRLRSQPSAHELEYLRLNLGVAWMRVGNWTEARGLLEQVRLGEGAGVSGPTVQYLLGVCLEHLGQHEDARRAWKQAATSATARLADGGPLIKTLAQQKLAGGSGRSATP